MAAIESEANRKLKNQSFGRSSSHSYVADWHGASNYIPFPNYHHAVDPKGPVHPSCVAQGYVRRPYRIEYCLVQSTTNGRPNVALRKYREARENGLEEDILEPFPSACFESLPIESMVQREPGSGHTSFQYYPDECGRYWWRLVLKDGSIREDFYWTKDEVRGWPDKSDKDRYWFIVHGPGNIKIKGFSIEADKEKGCPDRNYSYNRYIQYTECSHIKSWMEKKDRNYLQRITPLVYPYEYALMSHAVYMKQASLDPSEIQCLQSEQKLTQLGWGRMFLTPPLNAVGYFAVTYVNSKKNHVVIAHRGTDSNITRNLVSDLWIAVGLFPGCDYSSDYSKKIRSFKSLQGYTFSETGHSLGAIYAEYNATKIFYCKAVTFDSPGCIGLSFQDISTENITNYLSAPNLINTVGKHPKNSIRLFVRHISQEGLLSSDLIKAFYEGKEVFSMLQDVVNLRITILDFVEKIGYGVLTELVREALNYQLRMHSMNNIVCCFHPEIKFPVLQRAIETWPTPWAYLIFMTNPLNYNLFQQISESFQGTLQEKNIRYETLFTDVGGYKIGNALYPIDALEDVPKWVQEDYKESTEQQWHEFYKTKLTFENVYCFFRSRDSSQQNVSFTPSSSSSSSSASPANTKK